MDYQQATEQVMNYLEQEQFSRVTIAANRSCFDQLGEYLQRNHISYSPEAAQEWLAGCKLSRNYQGFYAMALKRLEEVCSTGRIVHEVKRGSCSFLSKSLRESYDLYASSLTGAPHYVREKKRCCRSFFSFLQDNGLSSLKELSYPVIGTFLKDHPIEEKRRMSDSTLIVNEALGFFYQRGDLSYGYSVILHYLHYGHGFFWDDVDPSVHTTIRTLIQKEKTVPLTELLKYKQQLEQVLQDNSYSSNHAGRYRVSVDLLFLFLDMHGYPYHPAIADAWVSGSHFDQIFGSVQLRKTLGILAQCYSSTDIDIETVHRKPSRFVTDLPQWAREASDRYVAMKTAEGWARSTLDMIRSCIFRFCTFLDAHGVRSFQEISISHVQQFCADDKHRTAEGKYAYATRIRRFLLFLGEYNYLSNPTLFLSLTCETAKRESVVVVLTREEMDQLEEALHADQLTLRKKAMLLLGLRMGMRSADIANLRYEDIHWDTASIRFVQQKTAVEIELPMPTEVGNALFRYITEERYPKDSPQVFLAERAPHRAVNRFVCRTALQSALPDRDVPGSSFHVTRKTFATNLLRGGVGVDQVAEALGHQSTDTVHQYLSLDEERMHMCPLSLSDCGIGGWKDD